MKKLFVLLLIFCYINLKAQNASELIYSGKLSATEKSTDIPAVFTEDGWIFIKGSIDGEEGLFLYDTGAMITVLSKEIASTEESENKISLEDPTGKTSDSNLILKNIRFNDFNFENIVCTIADLSSFQNQSCRKIDGIIGGNLLKLANWKVEPSIGKVSSSKEPFIPAFSSSGTDIGYYNKLLPLIEISLDNKKQWVLIDTGSTSYFELNNDFIKSSKFKKQKKITGEGISITINGQDRRTTELLYVDEFTLQGISFKNLPTLISKNKPIIGSKFFNGFTTIFNFSENKLYLDSQKKSVVFNSLKNFDMNFCLNEKNQLSVCFLWDKSNSGIKYGDQIIKINGKSIDVLNHDDYCKIKDNILKQDNIDVTVKSDGKEVSFNLTKKVR
ncbi:aspartyl protease family protein [Paenimyroides ummariense]|nr:aspartyl protease family protein [Paenimyroides ummariense]